MKTKYTARVTAVFTAVMIALTFMVFPVEATTGDQSAGKGAMQKYVNAMQPGWNLGNTFDAIPAETSWGNPPTTKALIDHIAADGFKSIRIPITWNQRTGPAPDYKIQKDFMNRIQQVIDWSLSDGLYVLINLHHDSRWVMNMPTQHDEVLQKYNAIWTQIATHFKNYPSKLSFESINEPRFSDDWGKDDPEYFKLLGELNTSFVHIVRKSGGNNTTRPLVLPGLTTGTTQKRLDELASTIAKLHDPHLIATIHYYGYYPFSVNIGDPKFDENAKLDIEQTFDRAYNTFVAKGIPVLVGEFGLLGFDKSLNSIEHGEMLKYFEYLTYYAKKKDLTLMLWDNGQHFNRGKFVWNDPALYNEILAGIKGRSSTAETDSIYIEKGQPIQAKTIKLNLHGNMLTGISVGDTKLTEGTDYTLNGNELTFQSELLKRLVTNKLGTNAVMTCNFSAGAVWKLNVIHYDTPQLRDYKGSINNFFIPTLFNGDRLETMTAQYANGDNAGPNSWTKYQQMYADFKPQYDSYAIALDKIFFDPNYEGKINLTIYFWSGNTVRYTLTQKLSQVSGVSSQDKKNAQTAAGTGTDKTASEKNIIDAGGASANHTKVLAKEGNSANRQSPPSPNNSGLHISEYIEIILTLLLLAGIAREIKNIRKD